MLCLFVQSLIERLNTTHTLYFISKNRYSSNKKIFINNKYFLLIIKLENLENLKTIKTKDLDNFLIFIVILEALKNFSRDQLFN